MPHRERSIAASALFVAVAVALASTVAPATASAQDGTDCDLEGCGGNAATVGDDIVFDGLYTNRPDRFLRPNGAGLTLTDARLNGTWVYVRAVGDKLWAGDATGAALDGLTMTLTAENGSRYLLDVTIGPDLHFWAGPPGPVAAYWIRVRKVSGPKALDRPLCGDASKDSDVARLAIVFEGDRYDDEHKKVIAEPADGSWFNLACAGTAMAKMHLLRQTTVGAFITPHGVEQAPVAERQAMLKMLTADYCGGGQSFTRNGQKLRYTDARGWFPRPPERLDLSKGTVEAVWGPDGAICLSQPRLVPIEDVLAVCRQLRPCTAADWQGPGAVISALPLP